MSEQPEQQVGFKNLDARQLKRQIEQMDYLAEIGEEVLFSGTITAVIRVRPKIEKEEIK